MNFCSAVECVGTAADGDVEGKPRNWGGACTPVNGVVPDECPCPTAFAETHNSCLPDVIARTAAPTDEEDADDEDPVKPVPSTVTVGNDPMMKLHGGTFVKFSLTPGVLSPLLSWTSNRQDKTLKMELYGETFSPSVMDAALDARSQTRTRMLGGGPRGGQCQNGLNHTLNAVEQLATSGGALACCPASCGQCGGGGCEDRPVRGCPIALRCRTTLPLQPRTL